VALRLKPQDYESFVWKKERYFVWMPLNRWAAIVFDLQGNFYQFISPIPKDYKPKNNGDNGFALACRAVCGKPIRRFHITCAACLYKMVWEGKISNIIPMGQPYILFNRKGRKFARLKNRLRKPLLSISEVLSLI